MSRCGAYHIIGVLSMSNIIIYAPIRGGIYGTHHFFVMQALILISYRFAIRLFFDKFATETLPYFHLCLNITTL